MPDQDDRFPTLAVGQALKLARQGKDAWNEWAAKPGNANLDVSFEGIDFTQGGNKDINFSEFVFPSGATFSGATFGKNANFANTTFGGRAAFRDATFKANIRFDMATFEGYAEFRDTTFSKHASFVAANFKKDLWIHGASFGGDARFVNATFGGTTSFMGSFFNGPVWFDKSSFEAVPDLRRTEFKKHITLHRMNVGLFLPTMPDDADRYRRLKELAVIARDHDREQEFFAGELKAKRGHETQGFPLIANYLYEWASDLGRSIERPIWSLFYTWFFFGCAYSPDFAKSGPALRAFHYSLAHLVPFLPGTRKRIEVLENDLFGGAASDAVFAMTAIEGTMGLIFLFLVGLALRNRFRI
tara:strand:+ start:145 stop:1215 length:1071 start_codon:yes stop_codon:yes gene_type:complete